MPKRAELFKTSAMNSLAADVERMPNQFNPKDYTGWFEHIDDEIREQKENKKLFLIQLIFILMDNGKLPFAKAIQARYKIKDSDIKSALSKVIGEYRTKYPKDALGIGRYEKVIMLLDVPAWMAEHKDELGAVVIDRDFIDEKLEEKAKVYLINNSEENKDTVIRKFFSKFLAGKSEADLNNIFNLIVWCKSNAVKNPTLKVWVKFLQTKYQITDEMVEAKEELPPIPAGLSPEEVYQLTSKKLGKERDAGADFLARVCRAYLDKNQNLTEVVQLLGAYQTDMEGLGIRLDHPSFAALFPDFVVTPPEESKAVAQENMEKFLAPLNNKKLSSGDMIRQIQENIKDESKGVKEQCIIELERRGYQGFAGVLQRYNNISHLDLAKAYKAMPASNLDEELFKLAFYNKHDNAYAVLQDKNRKNTQEAIPLIPLDLQKFAEDNKTFCAVKDLKAALEIIEKDKATLFRRGDFMVALCHAIAYFAANKKEAIAIGLQRRFKITNWEMMLLCQQATLNTANLNDAPRENALERLANYFRKRYDEELISLDPKRIYKLRMQIPADKSSAALKQYSRGIFLQYEQAMAEHPHRQKVPSLPSDLGKFERVYTRGIFKLLDAVQSDNGLPTAQYQEMQQFLAAEMKEQKKYKTDRAFLIQLIAHCIDQGEPAFAKAIQAQYKISDDFLTLAYKNHPKMDKAAWVKGYADKNFEGVTLDSNFMEDAKKRVLVKMLVAYVNGNKDKIIRDVLLSEGVDETSLPFIYNLIALCKREARPVLGGVAREKHRALNGWVNFLQKKYKVDNATFLLISMKALARVLGTKIGLEKLYEQLDLYLATEGETMATSTFNTLKDQFIEEGNVEGLLNLHAVKTMVYIPKVSFEDICRAWANKPEMEIAEVIKRFHYPTSLQVKEVLTGIIGHILAYKELEFTKKILSTYFRRYYEHLLSVLKDIEQYKELHAWIQDQVTPKITPIPTGSSPKEAYALCQKQWKGRQEWVTKESYKADLTTFLAEACKAYFEANQSTMDVLHFLQLYADEMVTLDIILWDITTKFVGYGGPLERITHRGPEPLRPAMSAKGRIHWLLTHPDLPKNPIDRAKAVQERIAALSKSGQLDSTPWIDIICILELEGEVIFANFLRRQNTIWHGQVAERYETMRYEPRREEIPLFLLYHSHKNAQDILTTQERRNSVEVIPLLIIEVSDLGSPGETVAEVEARLRDMDQKKENPMQALCADIAWCISNGKQALAQDLMKQFGIRNLEMRELCERSAIHAELDGNKPEAEALTKAAEQFHFAYLQELAHYQAPKEAKKAKEPERKVSTEVKHHEQEQLWAYKAEAHKYHEQHTITGMRLPADLYDFEAIHTAGMEKVFTGLRGDRIFNPKDYGKILSVVDAEVQQQERYHARQKFLIQLITLCRARDDVALADKIQEKYKIKDADIALVYLNTVNAHKAAGAEQNVIAGCEKLISNQFAKMKLISPLQDWLNYKRAPYPELSEQRNFAAQFRMEVVNLYQGEHLTSGQKKIINQIAEKFSRYFIAVANAQGPEADSEAVGRYKNEILALANKLPEAELSMAEKFANFRRTVNNFLVKISMPHTPVDSPIFQQGFFKPKPVPKISELVEKHLKPPAPPK